MKHPGPGPGPDYKPLTTSHIHVFTYIDKGGTPPV